MTRKEMYCRTCLCVFLRGNGRHHKVYNIFKNLHFAKKLMRCSALNIERSDKYPHSICKNCYDKVIDFYEFQLMCRDSLKTFNEMYTAHGEDLPLDKARETKTKLLTENLAEEDALNIEHMLQYNLPPPNHINDFDLEKLCTTTDTSEGKSSGFLSLISNDTLMYTGTKDTAEENINDDNETETNTIENILNEIYAIHRVNENVLEDNSQLGQVLCNGHNKAAEEEINQLPHKENSQSCPLLGHDVALGNFENDQHNAAASSTTPNDEQNNNENLFMEMFTVPEVGENVIIENSQTEWDNCFENNGMGDQIDTTITNTFIAPIASVDIGMAHDDVTSNENYNATESSSCNERLKKREQPELEADNKSCELERDTIKEKEQELVAVYKIPESELSSIEKEQQGLVGDSKSCELERDTIEVQQQELVDDYKNPESERYTNEKDQQGNVVNNNSSESELLTQNEAKKMPPEKNQRKNLNKNGKLKKRPIITKASLKNNTEDRSSKYKKTKTKANLSQCEICLKRFRIQHRLEAHKRQHKGLPAYPCTHRTCDQSFDSLTLLQKHLSDGHSAIHSAYKCDIDNCDRVYVRAYSLAFHKRKFHKRGPPLKVHKCEICKKVLQDKQKLRDHLYIHAEKSTWLYTCNINGCNTKCRTASHLKTHRDRHAGIKRFTCPHCGVGKATSSELKTHINHHTEETTWPCLLCTKVCKSAGNLQRHTRNNHSNSERQFKCSYCKAAFFSIEILKSHEKRHTSDKPYACNECDKRFIWAYKLKTHLKTHLKPKESSKKKK